MNHEDEISITLTRSQVAKVVRQGPRSSSLIANLADLSSAARLIQTIEDEKLSRSTLRSLLVFAAFPSDGSYRALAEVSKELGYNPSTTHRYASTWLAVGLLEQDSQSRRYRRAETPPASAGATPPPTSTRRGRRVRSPAQAKR